MHDVHYDLSVELDEVSAHYKGAMSADFTLRKVPKELWLDFRGGSIERLTVNGDHIKPTAENGFRREGSLLWLPVSKLKKGANKVTASYVQDYNTSGVGFHRFQDTT